MATDAKGRVIKSIVTDGTKADCKIAFALIKNIKTGILNANRAYNTNYIVEYAKNDIEIVILPKSNRSLKRNEDVLEPS